LALAASIVRLGIAYEPPDGLEKALAVIGTALENSAEGNWTDGTGRTQ